MNKMVKMPTLRNIILGFIAAFFALQIVSLILTTIFPTIPLFKGGPIILVFLLAIAIMALFILGVRYDQLTQKDNLIFIVIIFALLILAYVYLPKFLPQLFSIAPDLPQVIKSTIGSIFGG